MLVTIKTGHEDGVDVNIDLTNATLPQAMSTLIDLLKFMGYQEQNIKEACEAYAANGEIFY